MKNKYLVILYLFILSGCHAKLLRINGEKGKKNILLHDKDFNFYLGANTDNRELYRFRVNQHFSIKKEKNIILNLQELSVKLKNQEIKFITIISSLERKKEDSIYISIKDYEYMKLRFDSPYQKGDTLRISFGESYLKYENEAVPLKSVFFIMPSPPGRASEH